jgi:hypothetical protein
VSAPTGTRDEDVGAAVSAAPDPAVSPALRLSDRVLLLIATTVLLPVLWMGYGTDIDVAHVLETTGAIRDGSYEPSRTPGVPVFEAAATVLDPIGGHLLLNLATAVAGALTVLGIARLVREWGHDHGDLVALAFLASPVTIIASTSTADFMWALAFLVWGALAQLRDRTVLAGLLFGLAIGSRLSTVFLVAAFLVADGWEPVHRRRSLRSLVIGVPLGAALYIPSWWAFDRTLRFLETAEGYRSFTNNLGRFLYKNYANAGVALIVVVLVAAPALLAALRRWGDDPLVRFGVLVLVVTELLFFQLPWKGAHLLPALLGLLLWLAASRRNQRRFLWVVVAAVAVNGLVSFRPLAPDDPSQASKAAWDPSLGVGLLLNDVRCRLDFMDRYPTVEVSEEAWDCTLEPMRGPTPEATRGFDDS